jgi:L-cystine transport system permease protein
MFVAVVSFAFAAILGLITALFKIYKVPVMRRLAGFYISFIRGTPLLVQLYLICYGIPKLLYYLKVEYGFWEAFNPNKIAPIYYAFIAFSINISAYLAETIRASIEAVGAGQFEAARSCGMTQRQAMIHIVIPQALNVAIPNLSNTIISAVKDTSFIFIIGIIDVMGEAKIIGARGLAYLEVYVAVALIYWAMCFLLEKIFNYIEKRGRKYEKSIV